jgi:hypothetical protein
MRILRPILIALAISILALAAGCSSGPPKPHTYSLGERIELGHVVYTVLETQWMSQLGSGVDARVPQNRFFLVRLNASGSGVSETPVPAMAVVDDDGNSYPELTNGGDVPEWLGILREAKPAEALQGNVVFDAPARHYKLRIGDESEEKIAFVDLPLTFTSSTPELSMPATQQPDERPVRNK